MEESVDELIIHNPYLMSFKAKVFDSYRSENRRKEVLSVLLLIHQMLEEDVELYHDEAGCPYLSNGKNISISHTCGCAAVIISDCHNVSIDIEYLDDRVGRIIGRVLRDDEQADTLIEKLLHWCTKETLYKLYPSDKLGFMDIKILSANGTGTSGVVLADNLKRHESVSVHYRVFCNFVLTYAVL